jgi:uncharacterized protein YbjT (DUF2867 family)
MTVWKTGLHQTSRMLSHACAGPEKGNSMILITGASGTVGRAVLDEVRKAKHPVKAMYRGAEDAKKAPAGVPSVVADFADKGSMRKALEGVDTVYLVCSPIPQLVELETSAIEACRDSGVKHIVLNSALGAGKFHKSFPSWHRKVEEKLEASGMNYIILRPNGFMQNILMYNAPSIRTEGAFYAAMGEAKTSLIDVRDIAVVAAKALMEPQRHPNKIYELNGPEAFSNAEVAAKISRVAARPVKYVDISVEAQRKSMLDLGMPEWQVTALLDLQEYYVSGKCADVTDVLPRLLGRASRTLDQFLEESKDSFRSQAAGA